MGGYWWGKAFLRSLHFGITENAALQGWAVSCALVGCILGTFISGFSSQKLGRKRLLLVSAVLFLISALGTGLSDNFTIFVLFRIIGGMGIGIASNLSPIYIAEIAPAQYRGRLVSINQLTIVIGILGAQTVNWLIAEPIEEQLLNPMSLNSWNIQMGWRYMFYAEGIPALLFFLLLWTIPNSPRWMVQKGQVQKAKRILISIVGEAEGEETLHAIQQSFKFKDDNITLQKIIARPYFHFVLIGIVLAVLQQWCGINIIFLYAEEVFSSAGYSVSGMLLNVVITGVVNLLFTLLAMSLVDKIGRKKLLIIGFVGLTLIYLVLGLFYYMNVTGLIMLLLIVSAIACYALTLAPITWVVLAEIFPNTIREKAMAIATFALWTANTLLAFFFPMINEAIGAHGSFWLFALICGGGYLFVHRMIKETKGKSLEQIENEYALKENTF